MKMNRMRSAITGILFVFTVVGIVVTAGAATKAQNDSVNHKVLSFNLEGLSERGAKKWDVKGESAEAISENEVKLDNIVASAYGEEAEAVITADKGVYDRAKNNVKLEQNVHATIETTKEFAGDFVAGSDQMREAKAESGPAKIGEAKKSKTIITCDGEVQFDYEKNEAYFLKNVHVVNEDGAITADKLTVYLDPETKRLKEIVADGNVKIVRGENTSFSQKASYSETDKKVTLSGSPKLVLSPDGGMGLDTAIFPEEKK